MPKMVKLLCFVSLLALLTVTLWAQGIFATLTGVVTDPSESVVPNAKVTLRDVGSGSMRESTTNGEGYYTFASVPVGTYSLTIEAQGFKSHKEDAIGLGGGERRNVNVTMAVGGGGETVEVTAAQDFTQTAVDSGEKSFTLQTKELQNFTQVGSNAAEYVKITPGFAISNGTSNKNGYSGAVIGINANGDGGTSQSPLNNNYSYNGLKNNSLDIVADGAHVSDPGCNCDTPVNPNSDFLQEFKVLTSNYSAEEQKGPAVITSVTKSGGEAFHGNAFFYARNYTLNANDWLKNFTGQSRPQNKFYYPGGSIGGPVIIPGTGFNKSRQKLFFFAGFEYFHQVLDTGLLEATVPTDNERTGLFSPAEVAKEGTNAPWGTPQAVSATTFPAYQIPACSGTPNGTCIDPNMQALMNLFPSANADPASTGGFNYVQSEIFNQNNRQFTTRVDYNVSDNTKVFIRYNYQREVQLFPIGLWWRQTDQVPYPSQVQGRNKSDSITGTITHVFSPTMTNEVVMAYTYIGFPNVFADPKAVDRGNIGYAYAGLFNNGVAQIPSFGGSGNGHQEAALTFNPGGFEAGGASAGLYADKWMPSISDTVTKVVKTHTLKAGFFFEWIRNAQPANNNTNGYLQFLTSNTKTYGNAYADMLTGNIASYGEASKNRLNDISYKTTEFFAQDSWKVRRRLTVELGLRLTHFTPWTDDEGFGYSIFNPAAYSSAYASDPTCTSGPTFCGFDWHARNSSVPLTGFPTRAFYYQPRVGFAYDLLGTGKTVLRGGYGRFYYHSGQFTSGLDASAGVSSLSLSPTNWNSGGTGSGCATQPGGATLLLASNLNSSCINVSASPAAPFAVDRKDNKQPYTDSYSFTIAQRTPWQSLLEVAYVGNKSDDQLSTGGAGSNLNLVPLGAMLGLSNPSAGDPNQFRPLTGYGDLNTAVNNIYSNYNGLQVTWGRHAGRYTLQTNYTLQKSLGIVQPGNPANGPSVTLNPYKVSSNYGTMANDRRQLFNVAYSIDLGRPFHGEKFLGGAVNGWQVSGVTQVQSGANLTFLSSNDNFGMSVNCVNPGVVDLCANQGHNAIIPGSISPTNTQGIPITNQSILGTNAVQLSPILTCNPLSGLSSHQFLNGSCFAAPTVPGQNGPALLPVAYGPAYFNSDLSLFKNFEISESKKLQFRIQMYNFLNHPLWSFSGANNLGLTFQQDPTTQVITQSNSNFGKTTTKEGNRVIELAMKFYF